mgnify:CR=1 FL=1
MSKLKTSEYLYRYQGIDVDIDAVYRFLDKLNDKLKPEVEQISFEHTKKVLNGEISKTNYTKLSSKIFRVLQCGKQELFVCCFIVSHNNIMETGHALSLQQPYSIQIYPVIRNLIHSAFRLPPSAFF